MERIIPKLGIVYGPVDSRRLGISLGINLMLKTIKICSFDCAYCQYGPTDFQIDNIFRTRNLPSPDEVGLALENWFRSNSKVTYDFITFSGKGEPSLHPQFEEIVKLVKKLRDKFAPRSRLAILSNSSTLYRDSVQRALRGLDLRIMKLDAGEAKTFSEINQPCYSIKFKKLVSNLKKTKEITIQTMFITGETENSTEDHLKSWISVVKEIQPEMVQIYSLSRPAKETLKPVSKRRLDQIVVQLKKEGIQANAY